MARRSLSSEWFGFDGEKFQSPKSFGDGNNDEWIDAYRALFYLSGDVLESKNIFRNGDVSLNSSKDLFLEYVLLITVLEVAKKVKSQFRTSYNKTSKSLPTIKGSINFAKQTTKSGGIKSQFFCDFHELNQNDPILFIIREGSEYIKNKLSVILNEENSKKLSIANRIIRQSISYPCNKSLIGECRKLTQENTYNGKFKDLYYDAKKIAYYVTYDGLGLVSPNSKMKVKGLSINLNRIFERLLTDSLNATGMFIKDKEKFNDIYFKEGKKVIDSSFLMKPDCRGYISFGKESYYLIADAKHKVMSSNFEDEESDDCSINRNDLYQIISYSKTFQPRVQKYQDIKIVLFGLNLENGQEETLLCTLPTLIVDDGGKNISIERLTLNFGFFMKSFGRVLDREDKKNEVLKELGNKIIQALKNTTST